MEELILIAENPHQFTPSHQSIPPFLCNNFDRPDKINAISQHSSRFVKINL